MDNGLEANVLQMREATKGGYNTINTLTMEDTLFSFFFKISEHFNSVEIKLKIMCILN